MVVTEVDDDGRFMDGIDFDPCETRDPPPTRAELVTGVMADVRLHIRPDTFWEQYGGLNIIVVRGQANADFERRLREERANPQQRLYQTPVLSQNGAMNCQAYSSWLLTGTPHSADADAAGAAIHSGVQSGKVAAKTVGQRVNAVAPWNMLGKDDDGPIVAVFKFLCNIALNLFILWIVILEISFAFVFESCAHTFETYVRNRVHKLNTRRSRQEQPGREGQR